MRLTTRELTVCAMLVALALALSYLESFFPLSLVIPLPGVKLGLANVVTLFALYALGPGQAVLILLGRCFLGAMFAGNINALLFSLLGGAAALAMMMLLSGEEDFPSTVFPSGEPPHTTAARWQRQYGRWATPLRSIICRFCWESLWEQGL